MKKLIVLLCVSLNQSIFPAHEHKHDPKPATTNDVYDYMITQVHQRLANPERPRRLQTCNAYVKKVHLHDRHLIDVWLGDRDIQSERGCALCCSPDPLMNVGVDLSSDQCSLLPKKASQLSKEFALYFRSNKNRFPATLSQHNVKP